MNAPLQMPAAVKTTCPYCGVGCGVLARPDGHGGAMIAGDPDHPANFGRLCSKGSALGDTLGLGTRLLHPLVRDDRGGLRRVPWDDALGKVAEGLRDTIARHGPDAVAFYLSGQLLTEDYYVANKLMKGFIGSANVDTNSRLCMASSVAGHRRAFGEDIVPGCYADFDTADLIVLVGSNAAWCHPVLYQRMMANRRDRGAKLVVIDPRRTATAEDADLFLGIAPGTDALLFSGLLVFLADHGAFDEDYIAAHTEGLAATVGRTRLQAPNMAAVAAATGLTSDEVERFFRLFLATPKTVTAFSQGVNQSAQGTDKVAAIIQCHLATGRIGKEGRGPFSLTGQPNAMGGREVGGLANQLAAHMDFTPRDIDRVRRFWQAERIATRPGLKAVDLFDAIGRGDIKALWVMGTNPAVSLPDADAVRAALGKLDLFVVSENVRSNDTVAAGAHIVLPAAAWGEKDGTVTNSERRISRQRPFLPLPGEARPDWWIVSEVAKRLGFGAAFSYRSPADIFREHASLSAFENDGARGFNLGGLADLDDAAFAAMTPVQWPASFSEPSRFFASGGFFHANGRASFAPVTDARLAASLDDNFSLRLNTGRVRDQWHTMTRTGLSARLGQHLAEPFIEVHPDDAAFYGLSEGRFARLRTRRGTCVLKVVVASSQQKGSVFAPIHWSDATASDARVGALVTPLTDPVSGQPEAKATPVAVEPLTFRYRGFVLARELTDFPAGSWWARVAVTGGEGRLFASDADLTTWQEWAQRAFGVDIEFADYLDQRKGECRIAAFRQGRFEGCLFISASELPAWDAVKALFEGDAVDDGIRRLLLSGKPVNGVAQPGPTVCACFGIGLNPIRACIANGARSPADIGAVTRAGTNCGSCIPELKRLLHHGTASHAL